VTNLKFARLISALTQKGFQQTGASKHPKFVFFHNGRATGIMITLRHGRDELTKGWLCGIRKALKMPDSEFLEAYAECKHSRVEYVDHLRSIGYIRNN
jgi:hypothetical protein